MKMKLKTFNQYLLIILGLTMFSIFIWLRFIRERLPRDIPFNLSLLGFIILIEICCIYGYVLFSLLRKNHSANPIVVYLIDQLFKPLIAFDNFLKDLPGVQPVYLRFMVYLAHKLNFTIKDTSIFYFIFAVFPRLVLVSALVVDIFYFHQLYYLYRVLLIGILLFLHRYIIYSFKHSKELLIVKEEPYISSFTVAYVPGVVPYEDDDDDDDVDEEDKGWIPPTMQLPLRKFIEYQTNAIVYQNKKYSLIIWNTKKYWEEVSVKYNLDPEKDLPRAIRRKLIHEGALRIENITQLSVMLEYYNITATTNEKYKTIMKLIFGNYLLCWLYILIMSGTMKLIMRIIEMLSIYNNIENPFI
jgi:Ca2+/Na+ antiporter